MAYRYKFIDRYLEREIRCYCWIQLNETQYQELLDKDTTFSGTPHEYYDKDGHKFYEFHVDGCVAFSEWDKWP